MSSRDHAKVGGWMHFPTTAGRPQTAICSRITRQEHRNVSERTLGRWLHDSIWRLYGSAGVSRLMPRNRLVFGESGTGMLEMLRTYIFRFSELISLVVSPHVCRIIHPIGLFN